MTSRSLYHLTVNTGNVAQTTRAQVDQTVIDKLLPLIDNEAGEFTGLDMAFDLYRPLDLDNDRKPIDGGAIFYVSSAKNRSMHYVCCFACWKEELSESAWAQCREGNEGFAPTLKQISLYRPTDETPPPVPWLAVIILPGIVLLDPDRSMMMGDMERCLFWALAEGNPS